MEKEILDFLESERVGCLAVSLEDGTPHTAAMHFSSAHEPLRLFFQTAGDAKKIAGLLHGESIKASFTIGFSEQNWQTLQLDGTLRRIRHDEKNEFEQVHYRKNPQAKEYVHDDTAFLVFEPVWWRYSDYNKRPPRTIEKN